MSADFVKLYSLLESSDVAVTEILALDTEIFFGTGTSTQMLAPVNSDQTFPVTLETKQCRHTCMRS